MINYSDDHSTPLPTTGLHILAEIRTANLPALEDMDAIASQIIRLINDAEFLVLATTTHAFPSGGFTIVIALAESHFSVHTWPELQYAALDLFACNVTRDNSESARSLFNSILKLFTPLALQQRELTR